MADNNNPGNFANRPKEEVQDIASKGGQASHKGGFASMDPDKQVSQSLHRTQSLLTKSYKRKRLLLRVVRPPVGLSSLAARRRKKPAAKAALLLELDIKHHHVGHPVDGWFDHGDGREGKECEQKSNKFNGLYRLKIK